MSISGLQQGGRRRPSVHLHCFVESPRNEDGSLQAFAPECKELWFRIGSVDVHGAYLVTLVLIQKQPECREVFLAANVKELQHMSTAGYYAAAAGY